MASVTILIYDNVTKEIIGSRLTHSSRADLIISQLSATRRRGINVGSEYSSSLGLEFSDKGNPRADNVRQKEVEE